MPIHGNCSFVEQMTPYLGHIWKIWQQIPLQRRGRRATLPSVLLVTLIAGHYPRIQLLYGGGGGGVIITQEMNNKLVIHFIYIYVWPGTTIGEISVMSKNISASVHL